MRILIVIGCLLLKTVVCGHAATKGILNIESVPAGAAVLVNGENKGVTPLTNCALDAGKYEVVLQKEGYQPYEKKIKIKADQTLTETIKLKPQGDEKSGGKACITGVIRNITNDPLPNIPVHFEVITVDPAQKGFIRIMSDSLGRFTINWKDLFRKKSLKPIYLLSINYARDYMRIDEYECLAYTCFTKMGKAVAGELYVDPNGQVDLNTRLGQYIWVKAEQAYARSKPSGSAEDICQLPRTTKLIMTDQSGEWLEVKVPTTNDPMGFPRYDRTGWISRSMISEQYIPPVSRKQQQRESMLSQHPKWPANFIELIKKEKIAKGMTKDMVKASLGDPAKVTTNDTDNKNVMVKWEYSSEAIKAVTFKNDLVQSWE